MNSSDFDDFEKKDETLNDAEDELFEKNTDNITENLTELPGSGNFEGNLHESNHELMETEDTCSIVISPTIKLESSDKESPLVIPSNDENSNEEMNQEIESSLKPDVAKVCTITGFFYFE